jgi:cell division protein FtsB
MLEPKKTKKKYERWFYILPLIGIMVYIIFLLIRSAWANYGINQEISSLKNDINALNDQNQKLQDLSGYYQSNSYKERQARLLLNYQKSDEKVIILATKKDENQQQDVNALTTVNPTPAAEKSNPQKWLQFFID